MVGGESGAHPDSGSQIMPSSVTVIADVDVASEYYKLLCGISVSISSEKS